MVGRRILLIAYAYPPVVGSFRWESMCAHLERDGHEIVVLTTAACGHDGPSRETIRTPDAVGHPTLRRLLRRPPLQRLGSPSVPKPPNPVVSRLAVPDVQALTWAPAALLAARRLLVARRFDTVITSGPPHCVHLLPPMLGRHRPPWIADFRDGWGFEPHHPPFPTRAQRAFDARLERRVVQQADRVVAVTEAIARDLRLRLGVDARWIPNAWDPELEPRVARAGQPPSTPDRYTLVHTGSFSGTPGRDARPLLEAVRRLSAAPPAGSRPLELVLAGYLSEDDARLLAAAGLDGTVRTLGYLEHPAAVALQRSADALVLLVGERVSVATTKLSEYLAADRPIIVIGKRSEAARIVESTRTGIAADATDPSAIASALRRALSGELARNYDPRGLEPFVYPSPALALADEVERAVTRRSSRQPAFEPATSRV